MTDPCLTCARPHTTREQYDACIAAGVAMFFRESEHPVRHEPYVDADTRIVGGKSRSAIADERRPHRPKFRDGWVSFNGGATWTPEDAA